jgi:prepilin-type N-terminal cleavage/methylation domain-containing protein
MAEFHRRTQRELAVIIRAGGRTGFSLTELLVAMTITLMVMAAVASLFGVFGRAVSQSQATVELAGKLRASAWQMRQDLGGVTLPLVPWTTPESNEGYFELIEGPQRDATLAIVSGSTTANLEGDTDDMLLFTTRSLGGPFVGRYGPTTSGTITTIESMTAEVAWFCREAASQPIQSTKLYNLHRRQLVVMGYVGSGTFATGTNSISRGSLIVGGTNSTPLYDLSLRLTNAITNGSTDAYASTFVAFPNTLGDLTKRENRFLLGGTTALRSGTFPYSLLSDTTGRMYSNITFDDTSRAWEEVILTNVIGFDVRVFDPAAVIRTSSGVGSLYPGDLGYGHGIVTTSTGAYVDLGWGADSALLASGTRSPIRIGQTFPPPGQTAFQSDGMVISGTGANAQRLVGGTAAAQLNTVTYDTWSLHYEFNGVDEDGDGVVDDGTNGVDDNGNGVPDDAAEYETSPPYPVPLRGIEVRIRCYEPTSKQIRQITIRHSFVKK